jgi:hypothetical protein
VIPEPLPAIAVFPMISRIKEQMANGSAHYWSD